MQSNWLIQRNTNMTYDNVIPLLLHPDLKKGKGNPAAATNTLQDWGFLTQDKHCSELGEALVRNEISWNEAALVALSKRGSNSANANVKPFVVFCKVFSLMHAKDPESAYLSPRAFGRFLYLKDYSEITDEFCAHLNDKANPVVGLYRDIWYNALTETGLFIHRNDIEKNAIKYVETDAIIAFIKYVATHGDKLSTCPIKSAENAKYFDYMGSLYSGIVEILKDAPKNLINAAFPHYFQIINQGRRKTAACVRQEAIPSLKYLVTAIDGDSSQAGLKYSPSLSARFVAALLSKPFVILTGLSGSGKTKLAQLFIKWMGELSCVGEELIIGEEFHDGAYRVQAMDELDYKIYVKESGKLRTISKNAVRKWLVYYKEHPEHWGAKTQFARKEIQNVDTVDDNYMHGSDAILAHIAKAVLKRRNPFSGDVISRMAVVPVGADWTNNEKLLGYPDALHSGHYVMPDTGVLKLMLDARDNPNLPFFLILDEMNLSHVERYFADFLSAMESGEDIKLHGAKSDLEGSGGTKVPPTIKFPKNLFVIGTMNVDETTYMFSPKVLDRAQVIEFRVSEREMKDFLAKPTTPDLDIIAGKGAKYAEAFLNLKDTPPPLDKGKSTTNKTAITDALGKFFPELAKLGAEFGYRTASEILRFCAYYLAADVPVDDAIDAAIVQKLLPKLHGSQLRLASVLRTLQDLSLREYKVGASDEDKDIPEGTLAYDFANKQRLEKWPEEDKQVWVARYRLTCEKIDRMMKRLKANGFTSFAEA